MKKFYKFMCGLATSFAISLPAHAYVFDFAYTNPAGSTLWVTGSINFSTFTPNSPSPVSFGADATVSNIAFYGYEGKTPVASWYVSPANAPITGSNTQFVSGTYQYQSSGSNYYIKSIDLTFSVDRLGTTEYYRIVGTNASANSAAIDMYRSSTNTNGNYTVQVSSNEKMVYAGNTAADTFTAAQLTGTSAPEIDGKFLPQALLLVVGAALIRRRSYKQDSKLRMAL